jgi:hypothetical protein
MKTVVLEFRSFWQWVGYCGTEDLLLQKYASDSFFGRDATAAHLARAAVSAALPPPKRKFGFCVSSGRSQFSPDAGLGRKCHLKFLGTGHPNR